LPKNPPEDKIDMQLTNLVGDRPFWKGALRLALPIALQNMFTTSFAFVDTIMISLIGQTDVPLSAVSMANMLSFLMYLVLFGLSSGAAVFISQYWGAKDLGGIRRTYGFAMAASVISSSLFTLVGCLFAREVMGMLTDNEEIIAEGAAYLRIASFSYIAIAIQQIFSTVLRSTEKVRLPMYVGVISVVGNVAFTAFFIFGLGMGVVGSAIGTVMAAWLSPVVLLLISLKKRNILIAPVRALLNWSKEFVRHYVKTTLPVLLNESIWAVGTLIVRMIFTNRDPYFYAAMAASFSVTDFAFVFLVGLCHACTVMVGKSVGADQPRQAMADAKRFAFLIPALSVALGGLLIAFRTPLLSLIGLTEETRAMAYLIMLVIGLEFGLRHIPYICVVGIFRAGGDTRTGLIYDTIFLFGLALPVTFFCAFVLNMNLVLVYAIMLLSEDLIKSILCVNRMRSGKWIIPVTSPAEATTVLEGTTARTEGA